MQHSHLVDSATVANLRDLGGIDLPGGARVRPGLALRSGQLDRLDPAADPMFDALGVRTVIDLRTAAERAAFPDRVPGGAHLLVADVLADGAGSGAAAALAAALADPSGANRMLGGGRAAEALREDYRAFVTSASARQAYKQLITALAHRGGGPVLFHCTAGKDRTGWGATLVLLLLGADEETVRTEYLSVDPAVRAHYAPLVERFLAAGGDPEVADAVFSVRAEYLAAALDALAEYWGDAESYARAGLGLKDDTLAGLRERLVEAA
ncbi:tyrosine-protein phosphatase [Kitasatospora cineracea]|uniref:Protein-tyrosine phosphatase n=1 Tax=Kitasatospora cineracea TaxID=88074 RepID=A0A3N4RFD7_9ACTN|nr:tyrosine-protein phosphatase [Kitasatospora cineracea]ROR33895.1 protein-tyrosine phosphatase [Kitasatospora cineracea]RPE29381.1 protein-tyrosine phosphatase [Kitasatospora cineracea]